MNNFDMLYGFFGNSLAAFFINRVCTMITSTCAIRLSGSIPSGHPKHRSPEIAHL